MGETQPYLFFFFNATATKLMKEINQKLSLLGTVSPVSSFVFRLSFIAKKKYSGYYHGLYCPSLSQCLVLQLNFYLTFKEISGGQLKYYK